MISISTLYCQAQLPSHELRYGPRRPGRGPVVVYNCTARCNLSCLHCYAAAAEAADTEELATAEAKALLDDLAGLKCPVVLFSGGEPLLREDLPELIAHAAAAGIRPVVSSNGTLIAPQVAEKLAAAGAAYVGVSIDGTEHTHNRFRRDADAFAKAMVGLANCRAAGMKVGLRMTVTARNAGDLEAVFDLIRRCQIPRACFYHLVYTGRGANLQNEDLTHERRRGLLDRLMDLTAAEHAAGRRVEILTVDNHADGPFLIMKMRAEGHPRADEAYRLLQHNGGNQSGIAIACVDNLGHVHADQFLQEISFGNVTERPLGEIWTDTSQSVLAGLRNRARLIKGRCGASSCGWFDICNANLRARALAVTGDLWASDPACYLTDDEIAQ